MGLMALHNKCLIVPIPASSLPRWIAEELTTDECSMDVRIARQRGEDIKLSSKSSSSSGKSTPHTKMKNQKETIYTHELDENVASLGLYNYNSDWWVSCDRKLAHRLLCDF